MTETSLGSSGGGSPMKACRKCGEGKPLEEYHAHRRSSDGKQPYCRDCCRDVAREGRIRDPRGVMIKNARVRARIAGVPFDLKVSDLTVPEVCPVLGTPIIAGAGTGSMSDSSPSLDRIQPALGYVPTNVVITSMRANRLKSDATLEEMEALVDFYSRLIAPTVSTSRRKAAP